MNDNQLSGRIPSEVGGLRVLQEWDLSANLLSQEIPSEVGKLTQLLHWSLTSNRLNGRIPTQVGMMAGLSSWSMIHNQISGSLPSEVGLLANLAIWQITDNNITGSIPSAVGHLTKLTIWNAADNHLSGTIPRNVGGCTLLERWDLSNNALEGAIPTDVGHLTRLVTWLAAGNALTGQIPSEIGLVTRLTTWSLSDTQLTGNIPSQVLLITGLTRWSLSNTFLTTSTPAICGRATDCTLSLIPPTVCSHCSLAFPVPAALRSSGPFELDANGLLIVRIGDVISLTLPALPYTVTSVSIAGRPATLNSQTIDGSTYALTVTRTTPIELRLVHPSTGELVQTDPSSGSFIIIDSATPSPTNSPSPSHSSGPLSTSPTASATSTKSTTPTTTVTPSQTPTTTVTPSTTASTSITPTTTPSPSISATQSPSIVVPERSENSGTSTPVIVGVTVTGGTTFGVVLILVYIRRSPGVQKSKLELLPRHGTWADPPTATLAFEVEARVGGAICASPWEAKLQRLLDTPGTVLDALKSLTPLVPVTGKRRSFAGPNQFDWDGLVATHTAELRPILGQYPNYSKDFALAIRIYTLQSPAVFRIINSAMTESNRGEGSDGVSDALRYCLPFIRLLDKALVRLPTQHYTGTCYRTLPIVFPNLDAQFQVNQVLCWTSFSSTSILPETTISESFAGTGPCTIFCIRVKRGYQIAEFSNYPDEGEVLLRPLCRLRVIAVTKFSPARPDIVNLEELI
eukprot:c9601_g1_i1.p1 GENE.c9601_g1_i1~~c9601_g1_i1.p1  ORF type:complete len:742 (+),score=79.66 c9601_g1_i1:825-3050(+)